LRAQLLTARKAADPVATAALRCALAAIDNAETPGDTEPVMYTATEAARRPLTDAAVRALLDAEITERLDAAAAMEKAGAPERGAVLRAEVTVLAQVLRAGLDV